MKLPKERLEGLLHNAVIDHRKKNLYADCPWCGESEFGISLEDNHIFNCFRKKDCGMTGNIYTLLKYLGRSREFLTDREIDFYEKLEVNLVTEEVKVNIDLEMQIETPPLLWRRTKDDLYLNDRGFLPYQYDKFEVGRSKLNKDYITFLVRRDGKLVGYVSRSEKKKDWIDQYNVGKSKKDKYLRYNNSKTDFSKTLFGIDEVIPGITSDVILVEGIFSKTKTDINLYLDSLDEVKCCATFGAKFSTEQVELLKMKGVKNIWLWFEADVLNKVKDIATYASNFFTVKVSYLNGVDPNDIDTAGAERLLDSAKNYLDFNMSYVKSNFKDE